MQPKPAFELTDPPSEQPSEHSPSGPPSRYVDIDWARIKSAEGFVTIFSQRRRDGVITHAFHREYESTNEVSGRQETVKTAFVPEGMSDALIPHMMLAMERLAELKAKRALGQLPFPEGGERTRRRS